MLRNMGVAGHGNCWGMDPDGITEDENLENIFSILDFPMESLEGNGFAGDWDVSGSHYLGPIPSNVLMEPLMNLGPSYKPAGPATSMDGAPETNPVFEHVPRSSGSDIVQQSNPRGIQEPVFFQNQSQSQSPISVLESSGSCSTQKNSPVKSYLAVPVRTRSKRVRASGVNPWLSVAPLLADASAYKESLNVRKHKLRRKSPQLPVVPESNKISVRKAERPLRVTDKGMLPAVAKRCLHCQVTKTPQWREGPAGAKTLCNACGMRYRSGRLFPEYRPAASPTFVPTIHSNSHKKVVQIRSKGKQVPGMIYQTSTPPPQPEFVPSNPHNKVVVPMGSKGGQVQDNMFKMYEATTSSPHPEFVPSITSNCLQRSVVDMYDVPVSMNDTPTSLQPESVPSIHLNSHKEVVEMTRSKGGRQVTDNMFRMYETQSSSPQSEMYDPPTSPQPEFVPMSSYLFDYIRETGAAVSPPV